MLLVIAAALVIRNQIKIPRNRQASAAEQARLLEENRRTQQTRQALFDEFQPVALKNCQYQRYGEPAEGGYVLCANLLKDIKAGYSYGIAGYDGWGCDIATRHKVPVHQYDCFDLNVPACKTGRTIFHGECVGGTKRTEDGRPFDTVLGQLTKNGDADHHVVMKMDIEGAEWESLPALPDEALQRIDQFVFEFHGVKKPEYVEVVRRLKKFFHVAYVHINNYSCEPGHEPFPGWAFEVLMVNKQLDSVDPSRPGGVDIPGMAKTNPLAPDCQPVKGERR